MLNLTLIDDPVFVLYCCVDAPHASPCASSRRDSDGQLACEKCGRRLSTVKHHRAYGVGRACHPRCKDTSQALITTPAAAAPTSAPTSTTPRKRQRTSSDPGEPINLSRLRTRAPRHAITPTIKKTSVKPDPVDISSLLDQTHARRMALIEAEKTDSHSTSTSTVNASAILW
jgi:hypothetical protein